MKPTVSILLALLILVSSASAGAAKWRGPFGVEPTEKNAAKADPGDWDVWWAYNGEEIIHRFGRDWKRTKSLGALHLKILPPLRIAALAATEPDEVRAAAVTAIGKCGMTLDRERILVPLAMNAKAPEAVRQAAVLALGFHVPSGGSESTGRVAARRALVASLADDKAPIGHGVRAGIALGLRRVAHEEVRTALLAAAADPRRDVRVAAILALGLTGDPAVPATLVTWLKESKIGERTLDDRDRSFVAWALGLAGDPSAGDSLAAAALEGGLMTRRAAILALGRLARTTDPVVAVLAKEKDRVARNFALVALARVGARLPDTAFHVARHLLPACASKNPHERAHASIAVGLFVRSDPVRHRKIRTRALAAIPFEEGAPEPEEDYARGAAYLARALLDDREHARYMWYVHQRDPGGQTRLPRTRAAGAIGGTLLGITAEFMDPGIEVEVARLREAGGRRSVSPLRGAGDPDLRTRLLDPDTNRFVLGGLIQGAGFPTDPDWSEPMLEILKDPKSPTRARAAAAAVLGELGDPHLAPVLTRLWTDANYPALTPTLRALAELL